MSSSSPFRNSNNSAYIWPPETVSAKPDRLYKRVTKFIGEGEPQQHWLRPYMKKLYAENFVNEAPAALDYAINAWSLAPTEFPPNQEWWNKTLDEAHAKDQEQNDKQQRWDDIKADGGELFQKTRPKSGGRVEKYLGLTPPLRYLKYFKEIPEDTTDIAATRGTDVHNILEQLPTGLVGPYDSALEPWVDSGIAFIKDFSPKFIELESVIYNDTFGYAGQFDFLATFPTEVLKTMVVDAKTGELWADTRDKTAATYTPDFITVLGDYKTSAKGIKESVALQLSMYTDEDNWIGRVDGTKDPLPHIDETWAINIREDGYSVIPVVITEEVRNSSRAVIEVAAWVTEISKDVLKPALTPREIAA